MQLLWQEIKKYKGILVLTLILATISQVFSLLDPQIFRIIIDKYATNASHYTTKEFLSGVGLLLLALVIFAFISRTGKAFQNYFVSVIKERSGTNLYARSVRHAFSLPYSVFEDQRSGELLGKMQKARADSRILIENFVTIFFLSLVSIAFVLIYSYSVHWIIGLSFSVALPCLGFAIFILSKKIKEIQTTIVKETTSLSGSTTETLRNVELVKSLGLEDQEVARLNKVNDKILALELKKVKMVRKLDFIQGTLMNALNSSILLLILWLIFIKVISLGQFFSLWFYSFWIFQPLYMVGTLATSYQEAKASLGILEDVLKQKPQPVPTRAESLDEIEKIEYSGVYLKYASTEQNALSDINISILAGEKIAFVGPSGSGKSSMVKLIAGLYMPTSGNIIFNNINMQSLNIDELRRRIGLVAQETQLFAGTIRENLMFVKPGASDKEMVDAMHSAQAGSLLEKNIEGAKGLDTRIGEGGLKLSGGEKQRLAIARAILRNPDIIIFDEATSSLDSITEKGITETIKKISSGKNLITIMVAHRLSTIAHVDKIYVFERGKIIETGTHDELVSIGGLYSALWREQIAEK